MIAHVDLIWHWAAWEWYILFFVIKATLTSWFFNLCQPFWNSLTFVPPITTWKRETWDRAQPGTENDVICLYFSFQLKGDLHWACLLSVCQHSLQGCVDVRFRDVRYTLMTHGQRQTEIECPRFSLATYCIFVCHRGRMYLPITCRLQAQQLHSS